MAIVKVPPPPPIAVGNPEFNRWLLTITAFVNQLGLIVGADIDLSSNTQFIAVQTQSAANAAAIVTIEGEIATINGEITTLQGDVTTLQGDVTTLQGDVTTLQADVTTLQARSQVLNGSGVPAVGLGNVGDWYADTTNNHIYVKLSGSWHMIV